MYAPHQQSPLAVVQQKMMALNAMLYKVEEMKREASGATDPSVKSAFEALAVEYQRRHDAETTLLLQQVQTALGVVSPSK